MLLFVVSKNNADSVSLCSISKQKFCRVGKITEKYNKKNVQKNEKN